MRHQFNSDLLVLARDLRGQTQAQLVHALRGAMSQGKLSKVENGLLAPSKEDVLALANALHFRPEFFSHPHIRRAEPPTYHRKRQKLSRGDWTRIYAKAEIYRIFVAIFLRSVELAPRLPPVPAIDPDEYDRKIEQIALAVRQLWSLPRGPIEDMTALLESAGIVIIGFDFGTELCDGFSQHSSDGVPPIVFVNSRQPKDKLRFTLAHELAHLVMHRLPMPSMEDEANRFAAEFLMPTTDILKDFYNLSLEKFMTLKMHWKVSMQALMYKARTVGRLTESAFRYYMTQMSKRGWRGREPIDLQNVKENPRVVGQLIRSHMGALRYSIEDMSKLTGLHPSEFAASFGLIGKPRLQIVM